MQLHLSYEGVDRLREQFQIFQSVVRLFPIFVVDNLPRLERAAKVLCHYQSVLTATPIFVRHLPERMVQRQVNYPVATGVKRVTATISPSPWT